MESPTLSELYWQSSGSSSIGPVRRSFKCFPAVVVLLKLRWLIRLHNAIVALAGQQCGFERLLSGLLLDTAGVHDSPHSPTQIYELIVTSLSARMQQAWPFFLAYVLTCERESLRNTSDMESVKLSDTLGDKICSGPLGEVVDDIFVTWLAQQEGTCIAATQLMSDLDFFNIPVPAIRTRLPKLRAWHSARKAPGTRDQHLKVAQVQAHHLAMLLELPNLRPQWELSDEEMMELARGVISHPKTFNKQVCARIIWAIEGGVTHTGLAAGAFADELDEKQSSIFRNTNKYDCGSMAASTLDLLRDTSPPRLVGHGSRFMDIP